LKQYLTKGKRLIVFGDYSDNVYQNREGNCEIGREILANAIYFNDDSGANKTTNETATANPSPVTQTTMVSKPSTADLKVPTVEAASNADDDDDLPF
jgi:single-stranded DNA-binding protein